MNTNHLQMHTMKKLLYLSILFISCSYVKAQLVINELMQSNIDCIMDDINEFPDSWVELYNAGPDALNLNDYSIGDSDDASASYQLPDMIIAPEGYALIYCDKAATGLHTDFRIDSGKGGAVYLFSNGSIVDKVTKLAKQPAPNIAYGRETDNSEVFGFQAVPTPGMANCGQICTDILGEPVFSENGRVITDSKNISLSLSLPDDAPQGTEIRMTFDGSEPTIQSQLYTSPISFSSTRIIRAKLFCDGYLSPRSTTQSFIFFPREMTLPIISIVTDDSYFNDDKIGIYVNGSYSNSQHNYKYDWRRPINLELFTDKDASSELNQLCETRVQGGASRDAQLKSLAIYANKRFGQKRFKYEFFPEHRPEQTNYKSLILRNAGNDFDYLYMRDAVIQTTMATHVDLDWQAWRPAVVYINGKYLGMLNIRERSNEDNIFTNYDELEDIDMIENWYDLKAGDWDNFNAFKEFYTEHGHSLAEYEKWMDWKEFINLMVMNLFYNNQDFPGNNFVMWRPKTDGGVWRFIAKDTDFGLGLYGSSTSYNTIAWIYNNDYDKDRAWANGYDHTRLFRRLMEDEDFNREFIDRAAIYMGDFMNSKGTRAVWDPMYEMIKTEYPNHRKLINQWWPNYDNELSLARNWLTSRAFYFYSQLADYYKLGSPVELKINENADENITTIVNGITLSKGVFNGKFFMNRALTINGTKADGNEVLGWRVKEVSSNGNISEKVINGASYSFNMPNCKRLEINAVTKLNDPISDVIVDNLSIDINDNGITLGGLKDNTPVMLYNLQGMILYKGCYNGNALSITTHLTPSEIYILKVGSNSIKLRK